MNKKILMLAFALLLVLLINQAEANAPCKMQLNSFQATDGNDCATRCTGACKAVGFPDADSIFQSPNCACECINSLTNCSICQSFNQVPSCTGLKQDICQKSWENNTKYFPPTRNTACIWDTSGLAGACTDNRPVFGAPIDCSSMVVCGDQNITPPEECDGTNLSSKNCTNLEYLPGIKYSNGTLSCMSNCTFDKSKCTFCGNFKAEPPYEECDFLDLQGKNCTSLGFKGGTLSCIISGVANQCKFNTSRCIPLKCGDGIVDPDEECDGTNFTGKNCSNYGFKAGNLKCTNTCKVDISECNTPAICGDNVKDPNEDCDGTDLGGATCVSLGFRGGTLSCTPPGSAGGCKFDTSKCIPRYCGDGIIDADLGEECDSNNLNNKYCTDFGFMGGMLKCFPSGTPNQCKFDKSGCTNSGCINITKVETIPSSAAEHDTPVSVTVTYLRYCNDTNDFFKLFFRNAATSNLEANFSADKSTLPKGSPNYPVTNKFTVNVNSPCTVGIYDLVVVGTSGNQTTFGWDYILGSGPLSGSKPSELSISKYEVTNITKFNSTTNFKILDIVPIQVIEGVKLIKNKATMVKVPFNITDKTWPKSDWPKCTLDATLSVDAAIKFNGKQNNTKRTVNKTDIWPITITNRAAGRTSFNFYVDAPDKVGKVSSTVWLNAYKQIPESDYSDSWGVNGQDVNVVETARTIKIGFTKIGSPNINIDQFAALQSAALSQIYPIPESSVTPVISNAGGAYMAGDTADKAKALRSLQNAFDADASSGNNYLVAVAPANYRFFRGGTDMGFSEREGTPLPNLNAPNVVIVSDAVGGAKNIYDFVTAHEIGHLLKQDHDPDSTAAGFGRVASDGWNVLGKKPIVSLSPRNVGNPSNYYCFMRSHVNGVLSWTDAEHYNAIATLFATNWKDPRILSVSGTIYPNKSVSLDPWYAFDNGYTLEPTDGNYSFELLDANNNTIHEVVFEPYIDAGTGTSYFRFDAEYPIDAVTARIKYQNTTIKEISDNSPPITNVSLVGNSTNKIDVRWTSIDNNPDLHYILEYQCDNGVQQLLAMDLSQTNFSINSSNLPGGNCRIEVLTSDYLHTTTSYSQYFYVQEKPLSVEILNPKDGDIFSQNYSINLRGYAYDPQLGFLDNATFSWSSNIDGFLGDSSSIWIENLSVGNHTITFTAQYGNLSSSTSVNITITSETNPDLSISNLSYDPQNQILNAQIKNIISDANYEVDFYQGTPSSGILIGNYSNYITANEIQYMSVPWNASVGSYQISAVVSSPEDIHPENNNLSINITVNPLPAGILFSYYKFENNLNDETGNNNLNLILGNAIYSYGAKGNALNLTNASLADANASRYTLGNDLTISAWINPSRAGQNNLVIRLESLPAPGDTENSLFLVYPPYQSVYMQLRKGVGKMQDGIAQTGTLPLNSWTNVVFVYNSTARTITSYKNGVLASSTPITYSLTKNPMYKISLGGLPGKVDEVKLWNYSLSQQEVLQQYNSTLPLNPPLNCTDECSLGDRICSGNGYQTCGNYDSDPCLEFNNVTLCPVNQTCSSGICVNTTFPIFPNSSLPLGILSYYKFENNLQDQLGRNNLNLISGSLVYTNGISGQSIDTTNTNLADANASGYTLGNDLTLSAWINPSIPGRVWPQFLRLDSLPAPGDTENSLFLVYPPYQSVYMQLRKGVGKMQDGIAQTGTLPLNSWTNVVFVYNSTARTITSYKNGVLASSTPITYSLTKNPMYKISLGGLPGKVDEVMIFNRALNTSEIRTLSNQSMIS